MFLQPIKYTRAPSVNAFRPDMCPITGRVWERVRAFDLGGRRKGRWMIKIRWMVTVRRHLLYWSGHEAR